MKRSGVFVFFGNKKRWVLKAWEEVMESFEIILDF